MKLIEAMKKITELTNKAADLRKKVADNAALLNIETPLYQDQQSHVRGFLQAHEDLMQEIARLRLAITWTNLNTRVAIRLGDNEVTKSITEWVLRRKEHAELDRQAWAGLTDRNLKEHNVRTTEGGPVTEIRIKRFFDPIERDKKIELYRDEPGIIDRTLEVTNAVTELLSPPPF